MKKSIIAALALTFLATPASSQSFIGAERLFNACSQKQPSWEDGFCTGFVIAIADTMETTALHGWSACIPTDATVGHLQQIVSVWLKNNEQDHKYSANSIVAEALSKAYPCGTIN